MESRRERLRRLGRVIAEAASYFGARAARSPHRRDGPPDSQGIYFSGEIALVEDDPLLRQSLGLILATEPLIEKVQEFGRAEDALRAVDEGSVPDVVVVDLDTGST